jgi:hypothetical protein
VTASATHAEHDTTREDILVRRSLQEEYNTFFQPCHLVRIRNLPVALTPLPAMETMLMMRPRLARGEGGVPNMQQARARLSAD